MNRRAGPAVAGVVVVALAVVVVAGRGGGGGALGPDEKGPRGLSITVDLAEQLDTRVTVIDAGDPVIGYDAVLVPSAGATQPDQARRWTAAAEAGASIVLGQPSDRIGADIGDYEPVDPSNEPGCTVDGLRSLSQPRNPGEPVVPGPSDEFCFGYPTGAQVVVSRVGQGRIVTLGGTSLFENASLSERLEPGQDPTADNLVDNGPMLAALTDMGRGSTLAIVRPFRAPTGEGGDQSPFELLSAKWRGALIQLLLAALLLAVARARRVGRHVDEPLPVSIAGSEHTEAVGDLLRRRRDPAGTATLLRAQILSSARRQLGIDQSAADPAVSRAVAQRLQRPPEQVDALLISSPINTESALVRLANDLEDLRGELTHGTTVNRPQRAGPDPSGRLPRNSGRAHTP